MLRKTTLTRLPGAFPKIGERRSDSPHELALLRLGFRSSRAAIKWALIHVRGVWLFGIHLVPFK